VTLLHTKWPAARADNSDVVWDNASLQTRQFARRTLALPAEVEVHPDHAEQLRLSFPDQHGQVTVIDVSEGGLGLNCPIFLPRQARLLVHVRTWESGQDNAGRKIILRTIVRRCIMLDVKPTFQIGLQYLEAGAPEIVELVALGEKMKNTPIEPNADRHS